MAANISAPWIKGPPEWQRRAWRYRKVTGSEIFVNVPPEINALRSIDSDAVDALHELQRALLKSVETDGGVRWRDNLHENWKDRPRGPVHPVTRSPGTAKAIAEVIERIHRYHVEILDALAGGSHWDAIMRIRSIIRDCGYRIEPDWMWGGSRIVPEGEAADLEFPKWVVRDQINRLLPLFEYRVQRQLTQNEIDTVVREAAEERLRRRQNVLLKYYGLTVGQYESQARAERRRRAQEEQRETNVRVRLSFRDRLLAAIDAHPDAGTMELARLLGARPKTVSEELRSAEKEGVIAKEKRGQKHCWRRVPNRFPRVSPLIRIDEREEPLEQHLRVDVAEADDLEVDELVQRAAARLRVRP